MIQSTLRSGRLALLPGLGRSVAVALVGLVGVGIAFAGQDKLPKAEEVLDKYVEATGGKVNYEKLNNRLSKAVVEFTGQGLKFAVTVYAAEPNKMYSLSESEAFGSIEKGTDGEVVWEMSVMAGPQIKEGEERAFVLRASTFDKDVNWRKLYKKAECVGVESVEAKPCYKIVLTPNEGEAETRYYDTKTNLLVKAEMSLKLAAGTIPMEVYSSEYKPVDGVLFAHKARVVVAGSERVMTVESIKHNVEMPKDRFKLPAEIQALVDKAKQAKPEKPEKKVP